MKHLDQKHPTDEQWMDYLYDEMPSSGRTVLEAHVSGCPPCQQKREGFRGARQSLDEWRLETPAAKHQLTMSWQPVVKWAAAAVLLVSTAFATGRISRPALDIEALQAQISKPIEERVRQQVAAASEQALAAAEEKLRAQLAARFKEVADKALEEAAANTRKQLEELEVALEAIREHDKSMFAAALEQFEAERMAHYLKFRADLERVAMFTQNVAQLASLSAEAELEPQTETQTQLEN